MIGEKWTQTIKISWSHFLTYRVNFFLQIIGPTLVFFFIKYNLWSTIYQENPQQVIQGHNLHSMLTYHLWVFVVTLLGQGHTSMNLSEDIRLGRISSYLIYPFNFWEYHTAHYLAFQILQILIVGVLFIIIYFSQLIPLNLTPQIWEGFFFTLLVGFFWYSIQYFLGLLAFWLEETWVLRVLFMIIAQFCSGAFFPIEFFPDWFREIVILTPLPYLTSVPVKIFMGNHINILDATTYLITWCFIIWILNMIIWRKGLKMYTGAGI